MGRVYKLKWTMCVCPSSLQLFHWRPFLITSDASQTHKTIVWWMSGCVWWCLEHVWWCLVVSDACLVVSSGVNVYRLIWPELIDVYGQISLPVHVTETLMPWMGWCADTADALMLLKCWCIWCTVAANMLLLQMHRCYDAQKLLFCLCCW